MLLAQEFGVGQVLWSILWFFLFFMWIWLVITIFADIIRSDQSGWAKAGWTVLIIFLPFFGVFIYLIVNGGQMSDRAVADAKAQDEAARAYIRDAAGSKSTSEQLSELAELHKAGTLDDEEYAKAKAKVLG